MSNSKTRASEFILSTLHDALDKNISIRDEFFSIGADSVVIVRLRQAIEDEFEVDVSIEDFINGRFETIAELTTFVEEKMDTDKASSTTEKTVEELTI